MSYGLSLTTVPKDLYYVERKLVADQAAEIERLREMIPVIRESGAVVHGLRGSPSAIWTTMIDAMLSDGQ